MGNEDSHIDFLWLVFIGVNRLGFTHQSIGRQYFGYWMDLFETYKKQYNFEKKGNLYALNEPEGISSLDLL